MHRHGMVIRVKPDRVQEYKALHAAVWPEILAAISASNIRNYSIFMHGDLLFGYFEYVGDDLEADWAKMAAAPGMRDWWDLTDPMQEPLLSRKEGEWWTTMEEVFHVA